MVGTALRKLTRKNLMVEDDKVKRLQRILGAGTESEAVRMAIDRELCTQQVLRAFRRLRARRTLRDPYRRAEPKPDA